MAQACTQYSNIYYNMKKYKQQIHMKRIAFFCIMLIGICIETESQTLYKSIENKAVTSVDTIKLSKVMRVDSRKRMAKFNPGFAQYATYDCVKDIKGNFFLQYDPYAVFTYNPSGVWLQSLRYLMDAAIESKVLQIVENQGYTPVDNPGIPNLREISNNAGSWYEISVNKEGELDEYDSPKTFVMAISKKYQLISVTEMKEEY